MSTHQSDNYMYVQKNYNMYINFTYRERLEGILGGDVESAGGFGRSIGQDNGDALLDVLKFLAVVGIEDWFSGTVAYPLRECSYA